MKISLISLVFILTSLLSFGQDGPSNGVADSKVVYYALQHVNVYVSSTELVENATVLIKGDKIEKIGKLINLPNGCVEIDMEGKCIGCADGGLREQSSTDSFGGASA